MNQPSDEDTTSSNISYSSRSSNFYLGMIQKLEHAIKHKRKNVISKNSKALISEEKLENIQIGCTKRQDSDINLQYPNTEQDFVTKSEARFLNKDECYDDIRDISKGNLNSDIFCPLSSLSTSADETLDILSNTSDTRTVYEKEVGNLKETEQKKTVCELTQVDNVQ